MSANLVEHWKYSCQNQQQKSLFDLRKGFLLFEGT